MNRFILSAALSLGMAFAACAAPANIDGLTIDGVKLEHSGQFLTVDMTLDLSALKVDGNRAVLLTPRLVNGTDSLALPSVGIYGRRRYYFYVRNNDSMLSGKDELTYKAADKPDTFAYNKVLPWQDWMNGAKLTIDRRDFGCCNTLLAEQTGAFGDFFENVKFFPDLVYVLPKAEKKKDRDIKGSANIDFPVDQIVIYPDYRRNTVELAKIRSTIDSVRNDRDITITKVWLKGFASPESPYEHNRELAIGRTQALKNYVRRLYDFPDTLIATDYEPEDWDSLRCYVDKSNLANRQEILDIIDSDRKPDIKEWLIKTNYKDDYRFLLDNVYPALRHTDYRIAYTIRGYSDVAEIERIMHSRPQNLSLNEFNLVAQLYEPGSDEFTEVYETAVRMYPDDKTANLNAANAAMRRGDNERAERYLDKAGDSPEAVYARGALAIRNEDYDAARTYLRKAAEMGVAQADRTLEQLAEGMRKQ